MEDTTEYLFCSAEIRPTWCKQTTNICCIRCDYNVECRKLTPSKVKPCTTDDCGENEKCEFMI